MEKREIYTTAYMARLSLNDKEADKLEKAISRMLEYFEKMKEIDVSDLEPTTHALLKNNRLRPDIAKGDTDTGAILDNAPELEDRFIVTPNVL